MCMLCVSTPVAETLHPPCRRPRATEPAPADPEAVEFAAHCAQVQADQATGKLQLSELGLATSTCKCWVITFLPFPSHAAAASALAQPPPLVIPQGAEERDGDLVISAALASPPYSLLRDVNAHNKRGTGFKALPEHWTFKEAPSITVPVAALWATLVAAGGIRLVSAAWEGVGNA